MQTVISVDYGGEKGIRTLDTIARIHAFQACAFNHSATSPIIEVNLIINLNLIYSKISSFKIFNIYLNFVDILYILKIDVCPKRVFI